MMLGELVTPKPAGLQIQSIFIRIGKNQVFIKLFGFEFSLELYYF